ncbi:MAG: hypothetical protein H6716_29160 [Polyangiaceae bacterium]|nr:hypothetical protein [Polyangiaceae bacterium]
MSHAPDKSAATQIRLRRYARLVGLEERLLQAMDALVNTLRESPMCFRQIAEAELAGPFSSPTVDAAAAIAARESALRKRFSRKRARSGETRTTSRPSRPSNTLRSRAPRRTSRRSQDRLRRLSRYGPRAARAREARVRAIRELRLAGASWLQIARADASARGLPLSVAAVTAHRDALKAWYRRHASSAT